MEATGTAKVKLITKMKKNNPYLTLRTLSLLLNVIWRTECSKYVPKKTSLTLSAPKLQAALVHCNAMTLYFGFAADHMFHIHHLLKIFPRANVTLRQKRCNTFTTKIDYLGHVIGQRSLDIEAHTRVTINDSKSQRNSAKLKVFLGLCNFIRQVVPDFATLRPGEAIKYGKISCSSLIWTFKSSRRWGASKEWCFSARIGMTVCLTTNTFGYWSRSIKSTKRFQDRTQRDYRAIWWELSPHTPYFECTWN